MEHYSRLPLALSALVGCALQPRPVSLWDEASLEVEMAVASDLDDVAVVSLQLDDRPLHWPPPENTPATWPLSPGKHTLRFEVRMPVFVRVTEGADCKTQPPDICMPYSRETTELTYSADAGCIREVSLDVEVGHRRKVELEAELTAGGLVDCRATCLDPAAPDSHGAAIDCLIRP